MFSVYGLSGRIFSGTMEEWRHVTQVAATARTAGLRPTGQDPRSTTANQRPAEGETQRGAIAAYTRTQQGTAGRHALSRVSDLMSRKVITVPFDASIAQAWHLLAQHVIGQAPAVDGAGRLVGLLLRADLLQPSLVPGPGADPQAWRVLLAMRVSELMSTPVPSAAGDTDIRRVTEVLLETGLPGLPVVDEHGTVTGFISRSDILRAVVADPPLELWA
jgi:CBS-domain-containing membrane protein